MLTNTELGLDIDPETAALLDADDQCPMVSLTDWPQYSDIALGKFDIHVVTPVKERPEGVGTYVDFATSFNYGVSVRRLSDIMHTLTLSRVSTAEIFEAGSAKQSSDQLTNFQRQQLLINNSLHDVIGLLMHANNIVKLPDRDSAQPRQLQ